MNMNRAAEWGRVSRLVTGGPRLPLPTYPWPRGPLPRRVLKNAREVAVALAVR